MKNGAKMKEGVKAVAWWQFFPVCNYLVHLLHEMIGIGNDLFDNFKDLVNAEVECLYPKEIMTRLKVVVCLETTKEQVQT